MCGAPLLLAAGLNRELAPRRGTHSTAQKGYSNLGTYCFTLHQSDELLLLAVCQGSIVGEKIVELRVSLPKGHLGFYHHSVK